ncbi:similar to An03g01670 [Aspergillus luchuensis]|uniref:Similar to An03g01670 n=1 Tax=Aspergillus kawachii TaxID=1069201 RepID=A0A146FBP7_ASPKA|nr:similar to An03g01670 [Aspergillus luchuensis]
MRGIEALAFLAAIGAAHGQSTVGFGPYFSLGPTQSWIREANTTLVLPEAPSPQKDRLALWPGMGTSGGDLIQALAVSFSDPNSTGQANYVVGTQLGGKEVPASAGDKVTMHYKYNDSTGKYDQTVSINGEVVSTLSTSSGQAQGWGTAVECQDDACQSTAGAHKYLDTTIILNAEDNSFGDTLSINEASSSGLSTSDNGKTWTVSTININSHTYNL